jgi:hypothetical protein
MKSDERRANMRIKGEKKMTSLVETVQLGSRIKKS